MRNSSRFLAITLTLLFSIGQASGQSPADLLKGLGGLVGEKKTSPPPSRQQQQQPSQGKGGDANPIGGLIGVLAGSQSDDEEIKAGEAVAAAVLGAARPVDNPKLQRYVNLVGRAIADRGERPGLPWIFAVVDTASVNAFAAPGGIVLVTRGLYEMLDTEDELAAVLAHEIAHVNRAHHYNVIKQQKVVEIGSNLLQREISKGGSANAAIARLGQAGAELIARGLDKEAEYEADRDGMVLAARAGYDASALLTVLYRLQARSSQDGALQLLFKTHPSPTDRLEKIAAIVTAEIEKASGPSKASRRIKQDGK